MTRRGGPTNSPAFTAEVALAAIKAEKTLCEVAQQFDPHAKQITAWKAQLTEGAAGLDSVRQRGGNRPTSEGQNAAVIGSGGDAGNLAERGV